MLKINNLQIFYSPDEILREFENSATSILNTIELNNVILTYSGVKEPEGKMASEADEREREYLLKEIDDAINKLKKDKFTRKAIIYNLFPSKLDHNCLNCLHLNYRNSTLNMNVYARSMNFDANFSHDLWTFESVLNKACKELLLNKGRITLFIMSLHKFVK